MGLSGLNPPVRSSSVIIPRSYAAVMYPDAQLSGNIALAPSAPPTAATIIFINSAFVTSSSGRKLPSGYPLSIPSETSVMTSS